MEPTRHEQYYMKDGINFQVENTLFKIPRYMLVISSPVLSPLLSSAHADDPPIRLANLKCTDFERLLALLYPLTPFTTVSDFWDEQDWISILRIATMWGMAEVRGRAIESLSKMSIRSPFTKITLGREYGHPKWVEEGFKMLSLRPEPLTPEECVHLTKEDVIKCAAAREGKIIVIPKATNKPAWRTVVEPKIPNGTWRRYSTTGNTLFESPRSDTTPLPSRSTLSTPYPTEIHMRSTADTGSSTTGLQLNPEPKADWWDGNTETWANLGENWTMPGAPPPTPAARKSPSPLRKLGNKVFTSRKS